MNDAGHPVLKRVTVLLITSFVVLALWNTFFLYPLKILVVLFHELSHGAAAIVSGGFIERIEISPQEGGVCYTRGGSEFLILNAGYLGSLVLGAVLLVISGRQARARRLLGILGAMLVFVTLIYMRSWFAFLYGLGAGALLLWIAAKFPSVVSQALLMLIGVVSCLYAVWDIGSDVLFRDVPGSDAHRLAELTHVPSIFWGLLWLILAAVTMKVTARAVFDRYRP